ncbi:hypothetical protein AAMO2058_000260600 [Amorphochlora amoebiformis]
MDVETKAPSVSLSVLTTVKDSQTQYGLRQDDYTRYRQYCCSRLTRIRKSVKFHHGKGHYKKRKLEAKHVKDERFLSIPLFNAERAWSYAMELKALLTKDDDSRKQHHLLRKLKRAVKWSKELHDLSKQVGDSRTQIEAEVYSTWMEGNEHIERSRWKEALGCHLRSKLLCEKLAEVSNLRDENRCKEMVQQLTQSIRLCKYHAKRQLGKEQMEKFLTASSALDSDMEQKFGVLLKEHKTQGSKIPVENKQIQLALEKASDIKTTLPSKSDPKDKLSTLTDLLKEYVKASSICQTELLSNEGAKLRTVNLDRKAEYLKLLKLYLTFQKLKFKLDRGQIQFEELLSQVKSVGIQAEEEKGKKKKKQTKVALSSVLTSLESLMEITQTLKLTAEEVKDNQTSTEIQGPYLCYRTLRCYYKADGFQSRAEFAKAYMLYQLCTKLAKDAIEASKEGYLLKEVENIAKELPKKQYKAHAMALMDQNTKENTLNKSVAGLRIEPKPLLERLGTFNWGSDTNLSEFPIKMKGAPAKQLYFDVAYHSIAFDSFAQRLETEKKNSAGLLSSLGLW